MTQKKHHGYHATPPGTYRVAMTPVPGGMFKQFEAVAFLNKHVGSKWQWRAQSQTLVAEFAPVIAHDIETFFAGLHMQCTRGEMANGQMTLALQPGEFAKLKPSHFEPKAKPLAVIYAQMHQIADRQRG